MSADDGLELDDDEGAGASPAQMVVRIVYGVIYMAAISYASYAVVKHADLLELRARGWRDRFRAQWAAAQQWRDDRNRMLFEAHYITREAAANGER
jgi:hypothetical protein